MCEFDDMRSFAQGTNRTDVLTILRRRIRSWLPAGLKTMNDYDEAKYPDFFLSQTAIRVRDQPDHPRYKESFCLLNGRL